jgi:hypothetical protein
MRKLIAIWSFLFVAFVSFGQIAGNDQIALADKITSENPLLIQYNYGTCYISHQRQITIEATQSDSLTVKMKKYMPIAYRLYKYKPGRGKYEAQDSIDIKDPFTFKFPKMGERDYCTVTRDYLLETTFTISRLSFKKFFNEFINQADKNKLKLSGTGIAGLYCYIYLKHSELKREYLLDGWYLLEQEILQIK